MKKLKVFVINLTRRQDRKVHILSEFSRYPGFDLTIVPAIEHDIGSWGLWQTIKGIITNAKQLEEDYIILCEDDHVFTEDFNVSTLVDQIDRLECEKADILLGGASWFETVYPVAEDLFWIKKFNGLQFTVIFRNFYESLLTLELSQGQNADIMMSILTDRAFVCYPYISKQKEFGYSDVTSRNAEEGYVESIFSYRMEKLRQLNKVAKYYKKISNGEISTSEGI